MQRHRFHRLVFSTAAALAAVGGLGCDKTTPPPGDPASAPAADPVEPAPSTPSEPEANPRTPVVPTEHSLHDRFEGKGLPNDCKADSDCHAAGCSGEICSADPGASSTCDVPAVSLPEGSQCGCVQAQCRWWNPSGATLEGSGGPSAAPSGELGSRPDKTPDPGVTSPKGEPPAGRKPSSSSICDGKPCAAPRECIEYYGVAGPRGPKFYACEIRCNPTKKNDCPDGMSCKTVTDGPGAVCR